MEMCASISFTLYPVTANPLESGASRRRMRKRPDLLTAMLSLPCFTSAHLIRPDSAADQTGPQFLHDWQLQESDFRVSKTMPVTLGALSICFCFCSFVFGFLLYLNLYSKLFTIRGGGGGGGGIKISLCFENLKLARTALKELFLRYTTVSFKVFMSSCSLL